MANQHDTPLGDAAWDEPAKLRISRRDLHSIPPKVVFLGSLSRATTVRTGFLLNRTSEHSAVRPAWRRNV